jgi:K+-transporting ATPase ATPase C chain
MSLRSSTRTALVSVRTLLLFTLVLGVGYTGVITAVGQLALPAQANGSLVTDADGQVVGSSLIGQSFTDADGAALPQYFQSRPSAAGDGYDGASSSGSNLGPENADLISSIAERKAEIAQREGVSESEVPADAVTASASGLDPHISPAYARLQVNRVADSRGIPVTEVEQLVRASIQSRDLGFLGEESVNVLQLNLELDQLAARKG